jgi:hypothetical protein
MAEHSDICTDRYSSSEILYAYLAILAKYQHTVFAAVHLERMEQIMRDNLSLGPLGEPDVRAAQSAASRNALSAVNPHPHQTPAWRPRTWPGHGHPPGQTKTALMTLAMPGR